MLLSFLWNFNKKFQNCLDDDPLFAKSQHTKSKNEFLSNKNVRVVFKIRRPRLNITIEEMKRSQLVIITCQKIAFLYGLDFYFIFSLINLSNISSFCHYNKQYKHYINTC